MLNKQLTWKLAGFGLVLIVWYLFADILLAKYDVLLDPHCTLFRITELLSETIFWQAIGNTLLWSAITFLFTLIVSLICALISHYYYNTRFLFTPFINIFRASPVTAVIIFLLLLLPWVMIPFIVGVLMVFPMLFQNLLSAFDDVSNSELQAAVSLGLNLRLRLLHVYLPNIKGALTANLRNSFGMTLKVVIAAQVLGVPSTSLGSQIIHTKQSFEYQDTFCYLVVVIILAYFVDFLLAKISRQSQTVPK